MKEIIYLNTDLMNSFMAQTFKGLPVDTTHEHSQQDSQMSADLTRKESGHNINAELKSGSISIPLIMMTPNGSLAYKYENGKMIEEAISLTQVDAGKEIISKKLHDNALNEFLSYLEDRDMLVHVDLDNSSGSDYLGDYVKITSRFDLFDLESIVKQFNTPIMKEIIKLTSSPSNIPPGSGKKNKQALPKSVEDGMKLFELLMSYLSSVLPTTLFLKTNGYVAPLKTEYLRESSGELNFKYGSGSNIEMTLIGRATKVFDSFSGDMFIGGSFSEVSEAVRGAIETMTSELQTINKGDIVISPVAIYFE